ncbi:alkyl/aryl-sulfatase [Desulfatibacillum aliphaticivorans]|uniref:alkyl/aryl-sulfatase n=1 Tax=Desulfatibacillum aliphaticivorans TaxID=218208 RepID=UPI0003F9A6F3|nr:alkyl/aryl-sulfatase [Desulfatibacillum aliphaticivorans]
MLYKVLAFFQFIIIVVLIVALGSHYVSFGGSSLVVRAPEAPGESTVEYTPPPPPKVMVESLAQIKELKEAFTPTIVKVTDDIYYARGYALGGVQMVITDEGLVIIDTTESLDAAQEILAEFRKITDKPVKYIIYTHGHVDHIVGAPVFMGPDTQVIATEDCVEFMKKDFGWLAPFQRRCRKIQSGDMDSEYARKPPMQSKVRLSHTAGEKDIVWPTITFDQEYSFELGGKEFKLYHTIGETPDHLMVWMPQEKALFPGDLYYASFPNLHTPMLEPRPVRGWYESLDRMARMDAEYLIPGHSFEIIGAREIKETLEAHSAGIKSVFDQTIECINQGLSVEEAVAKVKLPPNLAAREHLQEVYGRVDWSVRGIYQGETGWYDGHGSGLNPLPSSYANREVVKLAGGADKLLVRAIELQKANEHQLACELCDVVIKANPKDKTARAIKADSLDYLGYQSGNLNMFGFYRSAAAMERKAAGIKIE